MKILNHSPWWTADLKALVFKAAALVFTPQKWREKRRHLHVTFQNAKQWHGTSGVAWLGGRSMTVRIQLCEKPEHLDKIDLAHTITHELGHLKGLDHQDMKGDSKYNRTGRWRDRHRWAADMPVRLKAEMVKPKKKPSTEEKRQKALAHAEAMVTKWEKKEKLAKTKQKVWKEKAYQVRYRLLRAACDAGKKSQDTWVHPRSPAVHGAVQGSQGSSGRRQR